MGNTTSTRASKKRKVGEEGDALTVGPENDMTSYELGRKLEQSRLQLENMTHTMQIMQKQMTSMQKVFGDVTSLRKDTKYLKDQMPKIAKSMNTMHTKLDRAETRIKYQEVLLKNQTWKYSAPRPSRDYWNNSENEREPAKQFLAQIKKQTQDLRSEDDNIKCDRVVSILDARLSYNEEFLPHWREFAAALKQYQYSLMFLPKDIDTTLQLKGVELSDEVLDLLAKALESTHFHRFLLQRNDFGQKGIDFALDYLENNKKLMEFRLENNHFNNINSIKRLCEAVKIHPSIRVLALNRCIRSVNGYEGLKLIMTDCAMNKLSSLSLCHNRIITGGDPLISNFLAKNTTLQTLRLNRNQLNDNDAMMIANALNHNTTLRTLNIRGNNITSAGWKTLQKAVFDKTNLNSAADSNHTCNITFPDNHNYDNVRDINGTIYEVDEGVRSVWFDPIFTRQKKIYYILSTRNRILSNVDHFDDDMPVELLPDMLMSIQKYSNYHDQPSIYSRFYHGIAFPKVPAQDTWDAKPLSIMFEMLQRCDKALAVFEALSS